MQEPREVWKAEEKKQKKTAGLPRLGACAGEAINWRGASCRQTLHNVRPPTPSGAGAQVRTEAFSGPTLPTIFSRETPRPPRGPRAPNLFATMEVRTFPFV